MTYKTILVHVEPEWGADDALVTALQAADMFGAHILGVAGETFDLQSLAYVEGSLVQELRDGIDVDLAAADKRFRAAVVGAAGGSTFLSGVDRPSFLMGRYARGADLIVARRTPHGSSAFNLCHPADLVMETGLPVLLTPDDRRPLRSRRVVVAWKDCREARRALTDAMPFMTRAERVVLVDVCPADQKAEEGRALREVTERLSRHGIAAEIQVSAPTGASVAKEIEDAAIRIDADLIVSGAYSHNRLREWVLGGVTQALLDNCSRHILFSR